ncbi:MAG: glutamate decarboxylase [Sphaerochaetaceae bacterium]|nr:glutamate decarboxylase [Sphaerochaetaceae bacterium]
MSVTKKETVNAVRQSFDDDRFAADDVARVLPKYRIPLNESNPRDIYQAVHDDLMFDGNSRQNLATFCQTWSEPEVHALMDESLDKNMIDKDEYPETAEMEMRCVHMLADLWHSPEARTTMGCSAIGSSEAAMLGGLAMKWRWREKRQAQGKDTSKPNLVTGPVQICWHKFAKYWDVELREIPMDGDRLIMDPQEVIRRCDGNTIGVVPTLGVTFTGQYEPVKEVSDALDQLQKEKGWDIPIHVDGASGGFLAPFVAPDLVWDFRLPRVKSINASGHKFGLAPLGMGWVVWRETADLPKDLIFWVNYLGSNIPTFAINFSRPGGQIIAQYYLLLRLGREGYARVQQASYSTVKYLVDELKKIGLFKILYDGDPNKGIPAVTWTLKDGLDPGFTLYDLSDRLRIRGWQVPAYSMPAHREDLVVMRILSRHGLSIEMADEFIADLKRSIAHYDSHPVVKPMTEKEAGGYNHSGR